MSSQIEIHRLKKRLDSTFERIKHVGSDSEIQADFSCYLCILVSGYFETAVVEIILDLAGKKSSSEISSFIERSLDQWTNPTSEKIIRLVGSFKSDWGEKAKLYFIDDKKETVNSLVSLRNKIAHGEAASITYSRICAYYKVVNECVTFLENLVLK